MKGKRGMSPLIATVLLIGFAVALGVMIMSITQPMIGKKCDDISFQSANLCKIENVLYPFVEEDGKTVLCEEQKIDIDQIETCKR